MSTLVVKLGSTLVSDERGDVRSDVLGEVCRQVAELEGRGDDVVLVTSGAIAQGMRLLGRAARPTAMDELQASSAIGQGPLYDVYAGLLAEHGVKAAQVLLTFFDMSARTQYINTRQTLAKLLEWDVVPVINENDTTSTDEIGFGDNDMLAAQVAVLMAADLLVILSDVDALYDCDPNKGADAQRVAEVAEISQLDRYDIGMSSSHIGSGGMLSKVARGQDVDGRRHPRGDLQRHARGHAARRRRRRGPRALVSCPASAPSRASSSGCATPRRRAARSWSTRAPSARCASRAPACCRSAWSMSRATSSPAMRST